MARVIAEGAVRIKSEAAGLDRDVSRDIDGAVDRAAASSRARRVSILPDVGGDTAAAEAKIRAVLDRMQDRINSMFQRVADFGRTAWSRVQGAATTALTAVTSRLSQVGGLWESFVSAPASRAWQRVRQGGEDAFRGVADRARSAFRPIADALEPITTRMRSVSGRVRDELSNIGTYGRAAFNIIGQAAERVGVRVAENLGDRVGTAIGRTVVGVTRLAQRFGDAGERVGGFANRARQGFGAILGGLQSLGSVGTSILGAVAGKAGLLTVAITGAVGALGGFVVAAPALLAGLAAPIAAVALGMDGIKRAAQAAKPALNDLKKAVSESFESSLRPAMEGIAQIIPQLTTGFRSIASALGGTATQMVNFVKQGPQVQILQGFLLDVSKAIQAMQPGLVAGTQAFMRLLQVASPVLVQLGAALGDMAAQWAAAINRMADTGILQQALQGMVAVVRSLGPLLGTLIEVFGRLGAALGGPVAAAITGITNGLQNSQGSISQFGEAVGRIFTALGPVIQAVLPLILRVAAAFATQLAGAVETVAPIITRVADALSGFAGPIGTAVAALVGLGIAMKVFTVISGVVSTVRTIIGVIRAWTVVQGILNVVLTANPIGLIVVAIGALVAGLIYAYQNSETFRNVVQGAFRAVGAAVQSVLTFFTNLGTEIAREFRVAVDAVTSFGRSVGDGIGAVVRFFTELPGKIGSAVAAIPGLVGRAIDAAVQFLLSLPQKAAFAIGYLAGVVYNGAMAAWRFLSETLPAAIDAAIQFLVSLPGRVVSGLVSLGTAVANGARTAWEWLRTTLTNVAVAVVAYVRALPGRIIAGLQALAANLRTTATNAWNAFRQAVVTAAQNIVTFVTQLPGRIRAGLASLLGILRTTATNAWNSFLETTRRVAQQVFTFVQSIPTRIRGFFANAGTWLLQAGRDIIQGLINGLKRAATAVFDYIADLGRRVVAGFKAATGIGSPSRYFAEAGDFLMQGLRNGVERSAPAVLAALDRIGQQVVSATSNMMARASSAMSNSGLAAAARELLGRLQSGGSFFEDLTFRGMSANLGRFNEDLMDVLDKIGAGGSRSSMVAGLQRYLASLTKTTTAISAQVAQTIRPPVGSSSGGSTAPRVAPLVSRDTGLLTSNRPTTEVSQENNTAAVAAAVQQGVFQAMSQVIEPVSASQLARINTRGNFKNERK